MLSLNNVSDSLVPNKFNLYARPEHERWTPTTKYEPADSSFNKDEPKGFNGEDAYHRFLTLTEQSLGCGCNNVSPKFYNSLRIKDKRKLPFGVFCGSCLLPRWDFIYKVLRYCDGCRKPFVLEGKESDFEPKIRELCKTCLEKVPVSKRVRRVSAVKIG